MVAEHGGIGAHVTGLSGWRCGGCGAVELDLDSALFYALACDALANLTAPAARRRPRGKRRRKRKT